MQQWENEICQGLRPYHRIFRANDLEFQMLGRCGGRTEEEKGDARLRIKAVFYGN